MNITQYLNSKISIALEDEPFKNWPVEMSIEDELDEQISHYIFDGNGLELRCDINDRISVIFLHSEEFGGFTLPVSDYSLYMNREQIHSKFGVPSKSGEQISHPILGESGAWDRYTYSDFAVHFEYKINVDEINIITLMREDTIP